MKIWIWPSAGAQWLRLLLRRAGVKMRSTQFTVHHLYATSKGYSILRRISSVDHSKGNLSLTKCHSNRCKSGMFPHYPEKCQTLWSFRPDLYNRSRCPILTSCLYLWFFSFPLKVTYIWSLRLYHKLCAQVIQPERADTIWLSSC